MNSRETAYLILRIFSLFIIIISLNFPMTYLYSFFAISSSSSIIPAIDYVPMLISFFPVAFGVYLWLSAKKLCSLFILEPNTSLINENDYSLNILKLAIVIMGLYLLSTSIPQLSQALVGFSMISDDAKVFNPAYAAMFKQNLVLYGLQITIALSMILGNRFLVHWINKARTFGLKK